MNSPRALFLFKFLLLSIFCIPIQAVEAEDVAGVVLSFDDTYVDQWYEYFGQRTDNEEVKVTFFVSHWHTLTSERIEKLRLLRNKGHEIGSHSYSHKGVAGDYNFDPNRVQEYLDDQVIPSLLNMQADGFYPVSFSYPSGERNETYDAAVRQYFPYLRTTFADENHELFQMNDIFHGPNSQYQLLAGDGIDNGYNNPIAEIEAAFLRAKTNNEIVTLYAHRIYPDESSDAGHRFAIRVSKLNRIIAAAKEMGLKFYTFKEAWQIGNQGNTDNNTGGTDDGGGNNNGGGTDTGSTHITFLGIQEQKARFQWNNLVTDFVGIVPAGENQWQPGMPGADAHGLASDKIGFRIAPQATDRQYVAIFYRDSVEVGRSVVFTIPGDGSGSGSNSGGTDDGGGGNNGGGTDTGSTHITFLGIQEQKARFQWNNLATDFIGIVPAGENQWQPGMPGADAHGLASDKIGFRITPQATDQQYVAVFYRDSVEVGRSVAFTVPSDGSGSGGNSGGTDDGGGDNSGGGTDTGNAHITFLGIQEQKARFQWNNLVTDFIGIVPAGENQWQPGMPGADAHGLASDKIGFKIAPQATDQQYIAIFYRDSVEVGRSVVFTVSGI